MWLQWQYSWTTGQSFQSILLVRFHRTNILIGKQGFCLFKWSLIYLRALNSNNFTGSIPPSLGKLSNLYWLDLADNQLTGSLPVSTSQSSGLDLLLKAKHLWVFFFPGNTILCERKKHISTKLDVSISLVLQNYSLLCELQSFQQKPVVRFHFT